MTEIRETCIYHVCSRALATQALAEGSYRPPSLASEGFIHFSQAHQVHGVIAAYYAGLPDLALLVVGAIALGTGILAVIANLHPVGGLEAVADEVLYLSILLILGFVVYGFLTHYSPEFGRTVVLMILIIVSLKRNC